MSSQPTEPDKFETLDEALACLLDIKAQIAAFILKLKCSYILPKKPVNRVVFRLGCGIERVLEAGDEISLAIADRDLKARYGQPQATSRGRE